MAHGADISKRGYEKANYDGMYRISANFLNYVVEKYDKKLIVERSKNWVKIAVPFTAVKSSSTLVLKDVLVQYNLANVEHSFTMTLHVVVQTVNH